jgi:hypothetical protein
MPETKTKKDSNDNELDNDRIEKLDTGKFKRLHMSKSYMKNEERRSALGIQRGRRLLRDAYPTGGYL